MRRRTVLRRSAVVIAIGLAGCTGGDDGGETATMEPTASPTASPTATPTPTSAPTESASPTDGDGGPTDTATPSPTPTETPTRTATGSPDQEVVVGPSGSLSFAPSSFTIAAGDTVRWTWDASFHNVRPSSRPEGADWPGTDGGDGTTYNAGYTYSYTFDVPGPYEYYCAPHRTSGMTGSFTVE